MKYDDDAFHDAAKILRELENSYFRYSNQKVFVKKALEVLLSGYDKRTEFLDESKGDVSKLINVMRIGLLNEDVDLAHSIMKNDNAVTEMLKNMLEY